ncbi:MAG: hypothetical protein LBT46_02020 [Planctomycetaceae bacterium]|nr:hypothetical protein [Planctomycetaceae bacterium]
MPKLFISVFLSLTVRWGAELYRHHIFTNRCFDEINLLNPKLLESIDLGQVTPFPTHSFDRNTKERIAYLFFFAV